MKQILKLSLLSTSVMLAACSDSDSDNKTTKASQPAPEAFIGTWLAPAYGRGVNISEERLTVYDYSSDYCFESDVVANPSKDRLEQLFILNDNEIELREGYGAKDLYAPGLILNKADALPQSCADGVEAQQGDPNYVNDPEQDLDYFYQTLSELSITPEVQNLDLDDLFQNARANLFANPSQEQLHNELARIVIEFKDGHTTLGEDDETVQAYNKPLLIGRFINEFLELNGLDGFENEAQLAAAETYVIEQMDLLDAIISAYADDEDNIKVRANDAIFWFSVDNIAYLQIKGMESYSEAEDDERDLQIIDSTLAEALNDLQDSDGLILDIRQNTGGSDFISLAIAGHFTDTEYLGYKKQARLGNDRTPITNVMITPRGNTPYLKPVILLTSNVTSSAAEVFTLAMKELPHVYSMGEATQGSLSDSLDKTLPNGTSFSLSNEIYLSADENWYEGPGIPADIPFAAFPAQDRQALEDSMLEAAFELLTEE